MRDILAAIESAEADIASVRRSPRGHLRVHAFPFIARHQLVPVLPDFLTRYPEVTFDFLITNRIVDIVGENVDIALRLGALDDSTLVARKVIDFKRIVCASPSYLAHNGHPAQPADLVNHACLTLSRNPGSATWQFRVGGELVEVNVKGPVSADSLDMLLELAIEGVGILRTGEYVLAEPIRTGQLELLLQDFQDPERYPLWALLPPGRHQAAKVKVFLDFLIERVASHGGVLAPERIPTDRALHK